MITSLKVMLKPNKAQATKMFQFAGAARFAYNWALAREQENYKNGGKFISDCELRREFTALRNSSEFQWLQSISSEVPQGGIRDACAAYLNFFKGHGQYPKFKSKKHSEPKFWQHHGKIQFTNTHVKLEKLTDSKKKNRQKLNRVRLAERGRIPSKDVKYMNPRISFDGLNWWVSVSIEIQGCKEQPRGEGIGIDLGIKDLAICSDGNVYKNINKTPAVKKAEKQKRRLQRSISRSYEKNKQGKVYRKTKNILKKEKRLLRITHRLANIRKNYIHQTTTDIVKRKPSFICIESLNVSGMVKNRHLSKAIQEQSFFEFSRQLAYKCERRGIELIRADRFYPSSKMCSICGNIKKDLKLSERVYKCPQCGNVIDRDLQAAINLRNYGAKFTQRT